MKLNLSGKSVTKALAKEFAPDILSGLLQEEAQDKTVEGFYNWLDTGSLWSKIPQGQQQFLISYKPWSLQWLDIDFIVGAIAKANKTLAILVATSSQLQTKLIAEIADIKERLE